LKQESCSRPAFIGSLNGPWTGTDTQFRRAAVTESVTMRKTAEVVLPLHYGAAPAWLVTRMKDLADEMVRLLVEEKGVEEFLGRLSDPLWFQAFGCVLGFDWHSSGLTTVVTGVLKDVLSMEKHQVRMAGGKGRASRRAQEEIRVVGESIGISSGQVERLGYASRMTAKVDTSAVQAGYPLYHHAFFIGEGGEWCVIQQGLNTRDRTARRYHWLSEGLESFVVEPHRAIVGQAVRPVALNMTAREAEESRKACVDLVRGSPENLVSSIRRLGHGASLDWWVEGAGPPIASFEMPRRLNWNLFRELYDVQPRDFEEFLAFRGVGPATVRALALVGQLIYGKPASWQDPVKFSFAHGGKDGVPYPVDRKVMDRSIEMLGEIVSATEIERDRRVDALKRLTKFSREWGL
jgi:uncharacterized protein